MRRRTRSGGSGYQMSVSHRPVLAASRQLGAMWTQQTERDRLKSDDESKTLFDAAVPLPSLCKHPIRSMLSFPTASEGGLTHTKREYGRARSVGRSVGQQSMRRLISRFWESKVLECDHLIPEDGAKGNP